MLRLVGPKEALTFTEDHFWLRSEGTHVRIGLTAHGIDCLRGVTVVSLVSEGTRVEVGSSIGWVESSKAAMDLAAPIAGEVVLTNKALAENPAVLDADPFDAGWLYVMAPAATNVTAQFMDWNAYARLRADAE